MRNGYNAQGVNLTFFTYYPSLLAPFLYLQRFFTCYVYLLCMFIYLLRRISSPHA